ncbi:MAG TPA: rRNA maturation RNase YbeY [Terriglobales bacterium]|nr:rRNA maturation RNase YbeY [Terriglobales bacterium]
MPVVILEKKLEGVSVAALARFAARARRAARLHGEVAVLVAGDRALRALNRRFRRKDEPTDVLSFPAAGDGLAGDIAISATTAARNARRFGHPLADELKVLILHGMLHLAGYDHQRDHGEMAQREESLRRSLGLPASLIGRTRRRGRKDRP